MSKVLRAEEWRKTHDVSGKSCVEIYQAMIDSDECASWIECPCCDGSEGYCSDDDHWIPCEGCGGDGGVTP